MKTIFWNVDTQYDFMRTDGALYVPGAEAIEGNLEKLTKYAATKGIFVVNTGDWHYDTDEEISDKPDYVNTFPMHCKNGTKGAQFVPATDPGNVLKLCRYEPLSDREVDWYPLTGLVLHKDKFDIFKGYPHTDFFLDYIKPECVVVYGVATNYCVDHAVKGLVDRKYSVIAVTDAMKELPAPGEPKKTLDSWERMGVRLATTEEVMKICK
jgi:nicotinamidase/pyrazinamidase